MKLNLAYLQNIVYKTSMIKVYAEVCSSCLKGCELIQDRSEGIEFLNTINKQLPPEIQSQLQLELGQCQRFCPENRVTVTAGLDPSGADRRLGASKTGDAEGLCHHLEARVRAYLQKSSS